MLAAVVALAAGPGGAAEEQPSPTTTADPNVPLKELRLMIRSLTKDDLKVEADGWVAVLKEQAGRVDRNKIEAMRAEGEERDKLLAAAARLQEQQTALIDRVKAVVEEWRKKGGDVEIHEKYIKVVSGLTVDVTDAGGTWALATGWLTSREGGLRWLKNVIFFLATLVIFKILSKILTRAARKAVSNFSDPSELFKDFLVSAVRKATFLIGLIVALSMLEVNIGPFLAAMGATGFILGFALQGTLSNFAAGLMILIYRPYDIGDFVSVAGASGTVSAMSLVSTTLRLPDNQVVVVPNSSIWGGIITNATGAETRRVDMTFGISYRNEIEKAQAILERIVKDHPLVLASPEPVVRLNELADSSVNFVVRPWVKTGDYWTVYWDVTRRVKEEFDRGGISIPLPQREVHVVQCS
jgi:small conductance mechanosensitive channel